MSPAIPKPKRRTKRSSRRRYAFMLLRQVVLDRDRHCQMSPTSFVGLVDICEGPLECAHIIGKQLGGARLAVAFEPDNCVALCQKHHRLFDGVFDKWDWAKRRLGPTRWAELQEQAKQRWDRDYSRVIAELKACRQEAS